MIETNTVFHAQQKTYICWPLKLISYSHQSKFDHVFKTYFPLRRDKLHPSEILIISPVKASHGFTKFNYIFVGYSKLARKTGATLLTMSSRSTAPMLSRVRLYFFNRIFNDFFTNHFFKRMHYLGRR